MFTTMLEIIKFRNNFIYLLLGIILLAHSIVITRLIYFPYPELFIYPYLTNHGLKPYSQILDQHFPGLLFLPINFDNLGMNTPEAARIWSIAIVLMIQIMLFVIGSEILKSKTKALLLNVLYLSWQPFFEGWILWIDNFLPLFLLPAFYMLLKRQFFITGLFIGLGIVFKQVLVPLSIFLAVYLLWRERKIKTVTVFLSGLFIPLVLMLFYFVAVGVLKDFWFWSVLFNLTTYAQSGRGTGPTAAHLVRVLFVFGIGFILLLFSKFKPKEVSPLLIFLTGTLLGLATRFDFIHFQPALPFAIIATVIGVAKLRGLIKFGFVFFYILVLIYWMIIFYKGHIGDRVIAFESDTLSIVDKIKSYTKPQEKIFVFGAAPHLYQMSNTLPAGDIFTIQVPWFLKYAEGRILEGVKRDRPEIIIVDRMSKFEGARIPGFAKEIDYYISQNYQEIDYVGDVKILRRSTY